LHSVWYRKPDRYANRTVIVVGSGASGRDAASQITGYARKVSLSPHSLRPP
jgi:cation diffusion facilitator CzcD-associated flavoprotein CzcO